MWLMPAFMFPVAVVFVAMFQRAGAQAERERLAAEEKED
jgi:hypothetical protein